MNITLHGERDQNDGMTRKQAPCCYSCTRYAPEIFRRNYGQIKKTNCKNAHIWDGSQHQHETAFCTFRKSPHNQWNSTTMLKHQDSNISSFTKLKTLITWNLTSGLIKSTRYNQQRHVSKNCQDSTKHEAQLIWLPRHFQVKQDIQQRLDFMNQELIGSRIAVSY